MKIFLRTSVNIVLTLSLIAIIHSCKKDDNNPIKDGDGNVYTYVKIGTQVWLGENLKTTRYNDNSSLPLVTDPNSWIGLTSPGYCWYNNDATANKKTYGAFYNWYAVNTSKLCPRGWHVPSAADWDILINYLGGESVAGGKMKEEGLTHWLNPNAGATNETGLTALPAGNRDHLGQFTSLGSVASWWSPSDYDPNSIYVYTATYYNSYITSDLNFKYMGLSVRCIKDN